MARQIEEINIPIFTDITMKALKSKLNRLSSVNYINCINCAAPLSKGNCCNYCGSLVRR